MLNRSKSNTIRYAIFGFLFGAAFPIISTLYQCSMSFHTISWSHLIQTQQSSHLLFVIDTAPLFLGLFAGFAGCQLDKLNLVNIQLKEIVEKQTEEIKADHQLEKQLLQEKTDALLEAEALRQDKEFTVSITPIRTTKRVIS